jgi:hypothetical protein
LLVSKKMSSLRNDLLYVGVILPLSVGLGYGCGLYKFDGFFGPIKTNRYYTIQHYRKTGGQWIEWNKLPPESQGAEWFCWQKSRQLD